LGGLSLVLKLINTINETKFKFALNYFMESMIDSSFQSSFQRTLYFLWICALYFLFLILGVGAGRKGGGGNHNWFLLLELFSVKVDYGKK
jgi:hypothetical protein